MKTLLGTALAFAIAGTSQARTIDVADYFVLGPHNAWQYTNPGSAVNQLLIRVESSSGTPERPRYTLALPLGEINAEMQVGFNAAGRVCFYQLAGSVAKEVGLPGAVDVNGDITFAPPACFGGPATSLDGAFVEEEPVDTTLKVEVSVGPLSQSVKASVTGTITATWSETEPLTTPVGTFDDVVELSVDVDLRIQGDVAGFSFNVPLRQRLSGVLARDVGFVLLSRGGSGYQLTKAILRGLTLGSFPPNTDLQSLGFSVPGGLLILHDRAAPTATGGAFGLDQVQLTHDLAGRLTLEAVLTGTSAAAPVPVVLRGTCRMSGADRARLRLDGRVRSSALTRPLALRARAVIEPSTRGIDIGYRGGDGVAGRMHLAVTPLAARRVVIDLAPFVDTMLNPGRVRVLAADGTLSLGDLQLPVTVAERLTSRAGQPDRRSYLVQQQRAGIVRIRTLSTGSADPQLVSLLSRILGRSARPDTASITLTLRR